MIVQDPRIVTWEQWEATLYSDLSIPIYPMPESLWKEWAKQVFQTTNVPPDPEPFATWQEWAMAWIRST